MVKQEPTAPPSAKTQSVPAASHLRETRSHSPWGSQLPLQLDWLAVDLVFLEVPAAGFFFGVLAGFKVWPEDVPSAGMSYGGAIFAPQAESVRRQVAATAKVLREIMIRTVRAQQEQKQATKRRSVVPFHS